MDKKIREAIEDHMRRVGVTNADLARKLEISPQAVGQITNGQRGRIPDSLNDLLEALDLELTVTPRTEGKKILPQNRSTVRRMGE